MNRREVIKSLSLITGHVMFSGVVSSFLTSCDNPTETKVELQFFKPDQLESIKQIIDYILPATTTKSASEVNAHVFLDMVFKQCMTAEQQQVIQEGLDRFTPVFNSSKNKEEAVVDADKKAYEGKEEYAFFKTIKQFTLIGFFTSKEGMTKASDYQKIPDGYKASKMKTENDLSHGKMQLLYYI